ncbi:conserved hypothetical protein [Pediculus humanus corporis]|uniref:Uncharacterized protein n=1 Tax=Pediculus humanus subsp. corporis TaxID=121224 RepID=E0W0N2_PEDHC|nr:uncharacterized protein Phum_PHUM561040 [Pediculus humanus corporis]EEB19188.1 conserved hypothetical protein [Pediculus humanus corporis]
MSTLTDRSIWSLEEGDSLENVDKEIKLVSTSSDSYSIGNKENKTESSKDFDGQYSSNVMLLDKEKITKLNTKFHYSCDNLNTQLKENGVDKDVKEIGNNGICRSSTHLDLNVKRNATNKLDKYDHVQSKVKQKYLMNKNQGPKKKNIICNLPETKSSDVNNKEYLEEINRQLIKELEEKNAILSILQDNYEHLLFKYAEAQNRIDELRFKCVTENRECKNSSQKSNKYEKGQTPPNQCMHASENINKSIVDKSQRNLINPIIKVDEPYTQGASSNAGVPVPSRPISLPLEDLNKLNDKDLMLTTKATTPTDSEGLSSVITSMSGHSKLLNSLDEETHKKSNLLEFPNSDFMLGEKTMLANDPFDKVKNWQNSLPPLEQIETPETALYNVNQSKGSEEYSSNGTKYSEMITSPKNDNEYIYLEDSCPPSWRDEHVNYQTNSVGRQNNSINCYDGEISDGVVEYRKKYVDGFDDVKPLKNDLPSSCIVKKRDKPMLLRCSSLPAYDYDSFKSENSKNGFHIPPLDLTNITLSDEESYCQKLSCESKSNNPSYSNTIERSQRTSQTSTPCVNKTTKDDDENHSVKGLRQTVNKSTSITPDKHADLDSFYPTKLKSTSSTTRQNNNSNSCIQKCTDCRREKIQNWCTICGETMAEKENDHSSKTKSIRSCDCAINTKNTNFKKQNPFQKTRINNKPPPFKRSMSFNSDTNATSKYRTHDDLIPPFEEENFNNFEEYTRNLKARSQVVINALSAHIKNS